MRFLKTVTKVRTLIYDKTLIMPHYWTSSLFSMVYITHQIRKRLGIQEVSLSCLMVAVGISNIKQGAVPARIVNMPDMIRIVSGAKTRPPTLLKQHFYNPNEKTLQWI